MIFQKRSFSGLVLLLSWCNRTFREYSCICSNLNILAEINPKFVRTYSDCMLNFFAASLRVCRFLEFGRLLYWRCEDFLSSITGIITVTLESNQLHVLEVFFPNAYRAVLYMVLRSLSHFLNADFCNHRVIIYVLIIGYINVKFTVR